VKVRPRIQREFLHWLSENRQRFAVPVRITRRTDRWIEMAFVGANPILSAILTRWQINIAVEWEGECWDLVESHEAGAVRSASGYFCTLCVPEARVFYPSREALWRDHLFETFLEWVNDKLLKARWIGVYGSPEIGVTWVKLLTDRPEHEREQHGKGIVVPLWNDATFLK
jgi:hypothetical protein